MTKNKLSENCETWYNNKKLQHQVLKDVAIDLEATNWLGQLSLLRDVPINYLVPDEKMLPAESIRFFYLDPNWVESLLDGAISVGLNSYIPQEKTIQNSLHQAAKPVLENKIYDSAATIRPGLLGISQIPELSIRTVITGFILRSFLVNNIPGLEIIPYVKSKKGAPEKTKILKMEKFGSDSDTLICFVKGELCEMVIREAPEALHYGIEKIDNKFKKRVSQFSKDKDKKITFGTEKIPVDIDDCFRKDIGNGGGRVVDMSKISRKIATALKKGPPLDAAEMGFIMTEGVGMVNFIRK